MLRFRLSSLLLSVMLLLGLLSTPLVLAASQLAGGVGRYSCGVDNPSSDQCTRTESTKPIDCVSVVDPKTGVTSKVCKERPSKKNTDIAQEVLRYRDDIKTQVAE